MVKSELEECVKKYRELESTEVVQMYRKLSVRASKLKRQMKKIKDERRKLELMEKYRWIWSLVLELRKRAEVRMLKYYQGRIASETFKLQLIGSIKKFKEEFFSDLSDEEFLEVFEKLRRYYIDGVVNKHHIIEEVFQKLNCGSYYMNLLLKVIQ